MTPFDLKNKTILVTGASSGIGRQVAISANKMGANIIATGRDEERLKETIDLLTGEDSQYIVADLLEQNDINQLVEKIPSLDGVVHCAGIVRPYPVKFISTDVLHQIFDINYEAQVLLMSQITRKKKLNKKASIVFSSSIAADHPYKGGALYAGSKAALEAFSKVIALEFSHMEIRSNCIASAMVKTPMFETAETQGTKERMDEHIKKYPLGVGYPEDVANTAIYLLSNASKWMTGQTITLDGGFLLGDF
ncbi:MAG: SDR family oxidoreductase [Flavobacteriales bacterium]|nr:SDR family oxidoreductase [Flavobacteriales bacterium]MCB9335421.1 SDR family oxidoreductase [Flavobacteriales bacterium]